MERNRATICLNASSLGGDVFEINESENFEKKIRRKQNKVNKRVVATDWPGRKVEQTTEIARNIPSLSQQRSGRKKVHKNSYRMRKVSQDSIITNKTVTLVRDNSSSLISVPHHMELEFSSSSDISISPWSSRPRQRIHLTERVRETQTQIHAVCITVIIFCVVLVFTAIIIRLCTNIT